MPPAKLLNRVPPPTSLARSNLHRLSARGLAALTLAALALAALLFAFDSPAAQAQTANPDGVLWQAKITPAQHNAAHLPHINGWSGSAYGSIDGPQTFTDGGATFTLNWLAHRDGSGIADSTAMLLRMSVSSSTAFAEATLCAGDLSVPIPARNSATSHDFAISDSSVTATAPWTNGVPVGVGIVRSPATCASVTTGIVWEAEMTPGTYPFDSGVTGWANTTGAVFGSLDGAQTFNEGGTTFTVEWVQHNSGTSQMPLSMSLSPAAVFRAATLCAGGLSVPIPEQVSTSSLTLFLTDPAITSTPPWTTGTPVKVGIVRAPSTCDAITGGIVWRGEITPAAHPSFPNTLTGWEAGNYGSNNGGRTFTENGATFTVNWVRHRSNALSLELGMSRSASAAFEAATVCAGGLSVPADRLDAGTSDIGYSLTNPAITSTPPWMLGTAVTVGIVRAPATCASLQAVAPAASGTMPDVALPFGGSQTIDVEPYFSGTAPTYTASSSNPAVGVSMVGSNLTLQHNFAGTVTVTVTATNSEGSATQSFRVTAIGPTPGVVWQAEMTPATHPSASGFTGWSQNEYGSINGGATFNDGGVTFSVRSVSHNANTSDMNLTLHTVPPSATLAAATLCAGGLAVPVPQSSTGGGIIDLVIPHSTVTSTAPWILGAPAAVGIVRAPATCASLVTAPRAVGAIPTVGLPLNASQTIDVAPYFSGSTLTFSATSDKPSVTSASIAPGSSMLTLRNLSPGTVRVTVIASNPAGSVTRSFSVRSAADTLAARLNGLQDDGRLYFESGQTVTVTARVNAPAGTTYTWQALSPARTPQSELTISSGASGSFPNLVTGRTISVVLNTPEDVAEFYNLFLLRLTLTLGGEDLVVVDTKVMVTRAEPAGRAALVTADAGEDRTVTVGSRVTLQGRAGPHGASLSTYWKQVGGRLLGTDQGFTPEFAGDFLLFNQGGLRPNFIAPNRPDVITLRLDVEDEYGNRASDTVRITVVEEQVADTTPPKPIVITRPPNVPERPWVVPPPEPQCPPQWPVCPPEGGEGPTPEPKRPAQPPPQPTHWICRADPNIPDPSLQRLYRELCG